MEGAGNLAVMAGLGWMPVEAVRESVRRGEKPVVIALVEGSAPELEAEAHRFHHLTLGGLDRIISTLQEAGVKRAILAGKVTKELLFRDFVPDARMAALLARVPDHSDDTLLKALVDELAGAGVTVLRQDEYLGHLLMPKGTLSARTPDEREWADIRFAYTRAKGVAGLDLGQTVVVKNRAVLAIEAIDGTNACIRRGGELAQGGAVAVKVSKPQQDMRFDVPAVGADTLATMAASGVSCLAVEAGITFLLDREGMVRLADEAGLAVVGL